MQHHGYNFSANLICSTPALKAVTRCCITSLAGDMMLPHMFVFRFGQQTKQWHQS